MKKYGKYEKMPVAAPAKQPKVKNLLLQTYFTSLLCLVLCVTMFLGTSYAWFTSEVTNTNNEIYVGTLKVGLYKGDTNLANSDTKLFDKNIRWEPGYTARETIKIVNEGDLEFKYVMTFTPSSSDATSADYLDVAQHFEVWSYYHDGGKAPAAESYEQISKENGWVHAGNLAEVLKNNTEVLENNMVTTRYKNMEENSTEPTNAGTTDGKPTTDTYTIVLHMNENAPSEVMGQKIGLNVKLVAYQKTDADEVDGFDNNNYDNITYVSNTEELSKKLEAGDTKIQLAAGEYDVDFYSISARDSLTIIGDGPDTKISFSNLQVRASQFKNLTISNCTIERMPDKGWGHLVFGSSEVDGGVYTISNCVFNGVGSQGIYINQTVAATFNIENCTFNGDFGSEGAITIQNNDGVDITVNVTDCAFNSIPATSHEICVLYAYEKWTLNADGATVYWKAKP